MEPRYSFQHQSSTPPSLPPSYRASVIIKCDALWSLMRGFSSGQPPSSSLPPPVQRDLMSSLVRCAVGESRQQFLSEVRTLGRGIFHVMLPPPPLSLFPSPLLFFPQLLQPLQQRFTSLVHNPNFRSTCHDMPTQQELLSILEALCGLAQNVRPVCIQVIECVTRLYTGD